ncbi:MAG: TraB/TrbI/VirB10 family type IV secretion system protein [Candidatus Acidiferrales bacterium]
MNEPIKDNARKPPGLLPKNVQSWVIIGIALLMVVIMWLTGGKKPQATGKSAAPTVLTPAPVEVNETKIAELQSRIQDLQKQQLAAQSALAQQTRLLGSLPQEQSQGQPNAAPSNAPPATAEDAIKAERRKREYLSLFASNLALTYRKNSSSAGTVVTESGQTDQPQAATQSQDALQLAQLLKEMQPSALTQQLSTIQPDAMSAAQKRTALAQATEPTSERKEANHAAAPVPDSVNAAAGKTYILFEGTVVETVLINRLDGQFSGPVECLLATDVYSHDRQHLLIPAGTKILGETKKVDSFGQTRLAVAFHRLIMPDGYSVSLDKFKGLDQIGDTGLRDRVNNHYLRIFGTSLAIGALGAAAEAGTGGVLSQSGTDRLRQGFGQSTAQSSAQILDKFLNIMPTVTIREGHRVKVYLSGDLAVPDYSNHKMPSDL